MDGGSTPSLGTIKKKGKTMKDFLATITILLLFIMLILAFIVGIIYILGLCWEYTLNTWLEFMESPNRVELWQCMLISLIPAFGQVSFLVAALTWIIMLFLE